ncbi:MAG: hypothetical protein ACPG4W_01845 [Flavobacteriales bacterium]
MKDDIVLNYIKENLSNSNLISSIKEIVASNDTTIDVPKWHDAILDERINNAKEGDFISLEELDKLITT